MCVFQHYLIGLALVLVCTNQICKANTVVECPNLPITPYPPVQTTTPTPAANSVTVLPTSPCQTTCIQNPPNFCQNICGQNPCQTTCIQNLPICSGTVQPTSPCQYIPCPTISPVCCQTQSVYPCPTNPCEITTSIPPPATTLTPTTLPATTTLAPLPPSNIIMCPSGTILIGDTCHVIFCPPGSVMQNDRCIFIECPDGTIWTGHRCSVPEPIVQNFTFNSTITTYINQNTSNIILNSTKNIVVNLPVTINEGESTNTNNEGCNNDYEDCHEEETVTDTTTTATQKCCKVMTPRICKKHNNRWHCYSRQSYRCGDFCIAPIIYLKPPRVYAKPNYVVVPPIQRDCNAVGTCDEAMTGGHDCSGCVINNMSRCSYYCYRYSCSSQKCKFFDHQKYCANNANDMFGCQEMDGCYDDWCLNNYNSL